MSRVALLKSAREIRVAAVAFAACTLLLLSTPAFAQPTPSEPPGDFVLLKSNIRLVGPTRLVRDGRGVPRHLLFGHTRYAFSDVVAFSEAGNHFAVFGRVQEKRGRLDVEEVLLQRVASGRFDFYTRADRERTDVGRASLVYFKPAEGPIQPVSYATLHPHLQGHAESLRYAGAARRWKRTQAGLLALGGAGLAVGLLKSVVDAWTTAQETPNRAEGETALPRKRASPFGSPCSPVRVQG